MHYDCCLRGNIFDYPQKLFVFEKTLRVRNDLFSDLNRSKNREEEKYFYFHQWHNDTTTKNKTSQLLIVIYNKRKLESKPQLKSRNRSYVMSMLFTMHMQSSTRGPPPNWVTNMQKRKCHPIAKSDHYVVVFDPPFSSHSHTVPLPSWFVVTGELKNVLNFTFN